MHLLGQRSRYTALNCNYHTLNIAESSGDAVQAKDAAEYIRNVADLRALADSVFDTLDAAVAAQQPRAKNISIRPPEALVLKQFAV